jgi:hypothetical protein
MAGKWIGSMPLDDASDCKILLENNSSFEFVCGGTNAWTGQGYYQVRADILRLEYSWIAQNGKVRKTKPEPTELKIDGKMNRITVVMPGGEKAVWQRKL